MNRFYLSIVGLFLIILLIPSPSNAAEPKDIIMIEPVVVTASRIEEPLSKVAHSIEVVTLKDIKERQVERVDEALRGISGLKINSYGGIDPFAWLLIRGTNTDHVLVLVDGVEINTPYDYTARVGNIQINSIERIEVLKGSHSAIYGSEAIGGVINIITKEGRKKAETDLSLKGGNYETSKGSFLHLAKRKEIGYSIGYSRLDTRGSVFTGEFSGNSASGKIKFPIGGTSTVQLNSFYWDHEKRGGELCCEIDNNLDLRISLPDKSINTEYNWVNSLKFIQSPADWFNYSVQMSRYDFNTSLNLNGDSRLPFPLKIDSKNTGNRDVYEIQGNIYPHKTDILTVGLQYRGEEVSTSEFSNSDSFGLGQSKQQPSVHSHRDSKALYIQNLLKLRDRFTFSAGARVEDGLGFGEEIIPRASIAYFFPSTRTKIKGAYGKGIRAASIRQLYDPIAGNRDLKPEKSDSYDISIEQSLDKFNIELTYFHIILKDLIEWSSTPSKIQYLNIGSAWTKGFEAELYSKDILNNLDLKLGYTYLETRDENLDKPLRYRPSYYLYFDARYRGINNLTLDMDGEIVGDSYEPYTFIKDNDGRILPNRITSYKLINFAASYAIPNKHFERVEFQIKVNNILNEDYREIAGFHTLGTNFLAGIDVRF
ncbi:MAG: TonB-dependent receptor [Nitrospinae bacterium]|nr:TonB-dependent receptor [Nitrospinota bacterium]